MAHSGSRKRSVSLNSSQGTLFFLYLFRRSWYTFDSHVVAHDVIKTTLDNVLMNKLRTGANHHQEVHIDLCFPYHTFDKNSSEDHKLSVVRDAISKNAAVGPA